MGLKFKKFRAKLNWKTKETVPQVVCLRYQIHSEFEDALSSSIPTTSSDVATRLRTSDVIKKPTVISKPPVQSVFGSANPTPIDINANNVNRIEPTTAKTIDNLNTERNGVVAATSTRLNDMYDSRKVSETVGSIESDAIATAPTKPKGILKKSLPDENLEESTTTTKSISPKLEDDNEESDVDDYRKSALIFMTENHDYGGQPDDKDNKNLTQQSNNLREMTEFPPEVDNTDYDKQKLKTAGNKNEEHEEVQLKSSITSEEDTPSSQVDNKMVNWRQTVEYYSDSELESIRQNTANPSDQQIDSFEKPVEDSNFKINFVNHRSLRESESDDDPQIEESEDETEVDMSYGSRSAYSSQAASIFFAGEEPEPTLRVRQAELHEDRETSAA